MKRKQWAWVFIIFAAIALQPLQLRAEDSENDNEVNESKEPRKKIIYRKKSEVDFSDAVIEGKNTNPEGVYVVTPPQQKFKGLLRLRPNFHKELIRDTLLLK